MANDKDKENTNDSKMSDNVNNDDNDNGNNDGLGKKTRVNEWTVHSADTKDMLVMRIDNSIEKVLSTITEEI